MDKILETIMNFINENTTLLIIICVFLIFVLIGYLIDNSIKTKRLERQMSDEVPSSPEPEVIDNPIEDKKEEIKDETKVEEPKVEVPSVEEVPIVPAVETPTEEIPVVPEIETPTEETVVESPEEEVPINNEEINNEVSVDPKVNDLLLRDFSTNGVSSIDIEENEVSLNPINNIDNINIEEPVIEEPTAPVYKNDKKLSDIFKKKPATEEPVVNNTTPKLENTVDFNNELDRILQKLNDMPSDTKDSTLDETQDFTNMF